MFCVQYDPAARCIDPRGHAGEHLSISMDYVGFDQLILS
jgi:hypothetical protein